jgi:CheY-like chemotaxis protein
MGSATAERRTILIVEDDELRAMIVMLFEDSDLEIVSRDSAESALATMLLRGRDVVMIFSDVRLPGAMDGLDLAREAKVRWPHLTVVLTSGNAGTGCRRSRRVSSICRSPGRPTRSSRWPNVQDRMPNAEPYSDAKAGLWSLGGVA